MLLRCQTSRRLWRVSTSKKQCLELVPNYHHCIKPYLYILLEGISFVRKNHLYLMVNRVNTEAVTFSVNLIIITMLTINPLNTLNRVNTLEIINFMMFCFLFITFLKYSLSDSNFTIYITYSVFMFILY